MLRRSIVLALLALTPPAAAAQEPVELAKPGIETVVGAAAGWTAWSEAEGRRARLVLRAPDGTLSRPPIATSARIFGLDLGAGAGGRPMAAFVRCATCPISLLDLQTGVEERLAADVDARRTLAPSVAGGRVAYVARPGRTRTVRRVRTVRRNGRRVRVVQRIRRQSIGTVRVLDLATNEVTKVADGPFVRPKVAARASVVSLDYDGEDVGVNWVWDAPEQGGNILAGWIWSIRVYDGDGGSRSVARTDSSGSTEAICPNSLAGPALTPTGVVYVDSSGGGWYSARRDPGLLGFGPFGVRGEDDGLPQVTSAAVDGDRLVVAEGFWNESDVTVVREYRHAGFTASGTDVRTDCLG